MCVWRPLNRLGERFPVSTADFGRDLAGVATRRVHLKLNVFFARWFVCVSSHKPCVDCCLGQKSGTTRGVGGVNFNASPLYTHGHT